MEEKFDREFKKKARCINPDVPEVVKNRISDTLTSLPEVRHFNGWKYFSGIAAILIISFFGVKFSADFLNQNKSSSRGDMLTYSFDATKTEGIKEDTSARALTQEAANTNNAAADIAKEATTGNNEATSLQNDIDAKAKQMTVTAKLPDSNTQTTNRKDNAKGVTTPKNVPTVPVTTAKDTTTTNINENTTNSAADDSVKLSFVAGTTLDGRYSSNSGIELILRSAVYDGKEIRVDFERNIISGPDSVAKDGENTLAATATDSSGVADNTSSGTSSVPMEASIAEGYEVKVLANEIPLNCSLKVLESKISETQYKGTIIIIPDSQLPANIVFKLIFEKVSNQTGLWTLVTDIK